MTHIFRQSLKSCRMKIAELEIVELSPSELWQSVIL
jgi:hypothetical protein